MTEIEEMIQFLTEKKNASIELSKTYVDKHKRQKFRDFAAAYVDALVFAEELKKSNISYNYDLMVSERNRLINYIRASVLEIQKLKDKYKDSGHCMRYLNEAGELLKSYHNLQK